MRCILFAYILHTNFQQNMPLSIANFHTKLDIQDFKLVRKFVIQNINSKFASESIL